MRYLLCETFIIMTLLTLNMPINAESPKEKEEATLIIVAMSNDIDEHSSQEFLVLQASENSIFWSFYEAPYYTKGLDEESLQKRKGKVHGKAERLTAAFSKVQNFEKQTLKSSQNHEKPNDGYITPYHFTLILMDSKEVNTCQLNHEQQVELSHCEELKPIFDIARKKIAGHKMMLMPDLLYAGYEEYLKETATTKTIDVVPKFPTSKNN